MTPTLMDLWLVFFTTLLASGHCIGMCGGVAMACSLGHGNDPEQPFWHPRRIRLPLLYTLGRLGTYLLLGAASGWLGSMALFLLRPSPLFGIPHVAVGLIMIVMGLETCGLIALGNPGGNGDGWLARGIRSTSGAPRNRRALGMGIITGLLPCSMHWAFQAKAFESGSLSGGLAILSAFGLGTLPAMLGFGMLSTWLDHKTRRKILFVAGLLIVVMGAMSLKRGIVRLAFF
ncbi:MAG: sulfite exporter TauE/SafE family protein [Magnetococcales bacterium]|nr:sulfite exporter TauE/SafE family protein [Magnetococcales bacterium]